MPVFCSLYILLFGDKTMLFKDSSTNPSLNMLSFTYKVAK